MNDFANKLLNELLNKYEKSKLSRGGTKVLKTIKVSVNDDIFDKYSGFYSYKYADDIDSILKTLVGLGYIRTEYKNDSLQSVQLVLEKAQSVYEYLNRDNPLNDLEQVEEVLDRYRFDNFMNDFIDYVKIFMQEKYRIPKQYFDNAFQLDVLLNIFSKLFTIEEEMKERDFSAKYLSDSKLFGINKHRLVKIIQDFDKVTYDNEEDVLQAYNIVKNSSYALVKNNLILQINESRIDLNQLKFEISLSDEMIKKLQIVPSNIKKVITVENLTSFYSINDKDAVIIYLAGFHNHTKQMLLQKIFSVYPHIKYYHFGDIDAGGFYIYNNLKNKTGIPFVTYRMGIEELVVAKENLKQLTDNDKKRLTLMLSDKVFSEFKEVIEYMLEKNVKLEQETLD